MVLPGGVGALLAVDSEAGDDGRGGAAAHQGQPALASTAHPDSPPEMPGPAPPLPSRPGQVPPEDALPDEPPVRRLPPPPPPHAGSSLLAGRSPRFISPLQPPYEPTPAANQQTLEYGPVRPFQPPPHAPPRPASSSSSSSPFAPPPRPPLGSPGPSLPPPSFPFWNGASLYAVPLLTLPHRAPASVPSLTPPSTLVLPSAAHPPRPASARATSTTRPRLRNRSPRLSAFPLPLSSRPPSRRPLTLRLSSTRRSRRPRSATAAAVHIATNRPRRRRRDSRSSTKAGCSSTRCARPSRPSSRTSTTES